ncbi:alpha/beta hydrolase family protein [Steroidobacter sp.]|uniref:alpha/beta hydrolase family protein n=1 Tax=Steroidobacter sp. TaxID=1978227 RepID=UPI001A461896|nr:alpha/beta fold hydrolase [Steroidobacter sp.]MBL8267332.1 alpha/beta fold hydrolase [Steroidobacter sp.]
MRKKTLWTVAALIVIAGVAFLATNKEQPPDTRYSGAYRFDDGTLVVIAPRDTTDLRYKKLNGETGALWPNEKDGSYEGGPGWAERQPIINRVHFKRDDNGNLKGLTWQHIVNGKADKTNKASRLPLKEEIVSFKSGELTLRGKLILPEGQGPFPVMIPVHGSEDYSAVVHYSDPYIHAASGVAAFVYDKRGTGGSEGTYTANFDVLSDDTVAAVQYLRNRKEIDGDKVHLAGYSQGGWIAPLAALKDGNIRSVLVGFGVAVPVLGEDRWGYVYAFQQHGFGDKEIAEMDSVAAILGDIFDRGQNRWGDFSKALKASRDKPWFETAKHSDSIFGMIVGADMPLWVVRPYIWWKYGRMQPPFIDRLYDPAETLAKLDTPSFWIFAGKDSSAPTPWSVEVLNKLQASGRPIEYFIYPDAEHGITRFKEENGERVTLGYEDGYFQQQVDWFRKQSGLSDPAGSSAGR